MEMEKIRVLVADDQSLICEGIGIILASQPDLEVVGTAEDGRQVLELTAKYHPDVVLLDIQMPVMSGIEALRQIKANNPQTVVLMLTTFDPDEYIFGSFRNGADGYLLKDTTGEKLAAAIRDAYAGNFTIPSSIAARILAQIPKDIAKKNLEDYNLTLREKEIAELICKGYRNEKIAQALGVTLGTVKNYICSLYSKLEAKNRKEAIDIITGLINSP